MTITPYELLLYAGALLILFMTPGPVWVALLARSLSGGFQAAWPLAMGVAIGDIIWPLVAVLRPCGLKGLATRNAVKTSCAGWLKCCGLHVLI